MPHSNRMKISAEAYTELKSDLRDLIASVRDRGDPMEKALLARQIEDTQEKGHVSALFQAVWVNTDFDDAHPRFHDGETEVIDRDTGKTQRAIRFAATRHLPFKGEEKRWVHRLQARPSDGGEDLTDDQIATAIKEIVRDLDAENALDAGALLGAKPKPQSDAPGPETLVIVNYDIDLGDEDANEAVRPDQVPLLGQLPFRMNGSEAHYRFAADMDVTEDAVYDDLDQNAAWAHFGFRVEALPAKEPSVTPFVGADGKAARRADAAEDPMLHYVENRSINRGFLNMGQPPEGQEDAYRKAWMVEADRRDNVWQKLLVERFGKEAGDARYDERGRGEFGEPLGEAFLHRQYAMLRAFPAGTFPERVVITHPERGVYVGNAMGLGFWSRLDPAGQSSVVTFETEQDARAHVAGWDEGNNPGNYGYVSVRPTRGDYATAFDLRAAGLAMDADCLEREAGVEIAARSGVTEAPAQPQNPHDGRFEFTGESRLYEGIINGEKVSETVWRIRATADFGAVGKGTLGGWIADAESLDGNAWVSGEGIVLSGAAVGYDARVKGSAFGSSVIGRGCDLIDDAYVEDSILHRTTVAGWGRVISSRVNGSNLHSGVVKGSDISGSVIGADVDQKTCGGIWIDASSFNDVTISSGEVTDSALTNCSVKGDAVVRHETISKSTLGYGYRSPEPELDGQLRPKRGEPRSGLNENHQKYILNYEDTAPLDLGYGPSERVTLYRIIRADADFENLTDADLGGYVARDGLLSHAGEAWIGPEVRLFSGEVTDDAQVTGKSRIYASRVSGKANIRDSMILKDSVVANESRVVGSFLENGHLTGRSFAYSSKIRSSLVEDTNVEGSTVERTYASDSRIITSRMESDLRNGQGYRIRESNLDNVNITIVPDPDRSADLRIERANLTDVDLNGQDCYGVTIDATPLGERLLVDATLSPRAASAWLHHRSSDELTQGQGATEPLEHPMVFLPDLPVDRPANENTLRAILIAGLRAKDPEITRYIDTVTAPGSDSGVIEAIMEDSRLRMALTDAMRQIPASLIGDKFVREPEDSRLEISMAELDNRMLDAQVHMSQLPGIRSPYRLYQNTAPRDVPDGSGGHFRGIPVILLHGTLEGAARPALYEPAFIETGMPDADFSSATIRTFAVGSSSTPNVGFDEPEQAHAFIADYLKHGEQAVQAAKGNPLPNPKAPVITGFDVDASGRATFLMKAAPRPASDHHLLRHEGYQAVIVDLAAFNSGEQTIHPSSLDGALSLPGSALRVAEARVERGMDWSERPPLWPSDEPPAQPPRPAQPRNDGPAR